VFDDAADAVKRFFRRLMGGRAAREGATAT
jgi:hypothetical protein